MPKILDALSLQKTIADELKNCSSAILCSAYITKIGAEWILKNLSQSGNIKVVGRFSPQDFTSGASDLEAIRLFINSRIQVSALNSLHAKLFLFDNSRLYLGSANYTGRGLALTDGFNIEASVMLKPSMNDLSFIKNIIDSSIQIDTKTLNRFYEIINNEININHSIKKWPETAFNKITGLYVKDFPLSKPNEYHEAYCISNCSFAQIYKTSHNYEIAKNIFLSSKVYIWLIQLLTTEDNKNGISYGKLSTLIHKTLLDDPKPYRRTVKELQSNLYEFIELFANEAIEFHIPGARSTFIRLK